MQDREEEYLPRAMTGVETSRIEQRCSYPPAYPRRPRLAILSVLILGACTQSPAPAPAPETRAERMAVLERIAADCGLPPAALVLVGEDQLQFRPAPDARLERVECVLREIEAANVHLQTAPAGNETYAPEANDAQAH